MADVIADADPVARSEKLSFWTKAAYALGDLGNSAGPGTIIPFWYLYFLTDVAKLDPALAGLAVLLGKIWDAVNDPLVGLLSDRTRTRWGRRRPYLLFGAVPFGLTFALLWIVPPMPSCTCSSTRPLPSSVLPTIR
jgi:GPH family glycoside/pentoside/hexuronide:cation symporter